MIDISSKCDVEIDGDGSATLERALTTTGDSSDNNAKLPSDVDMQIGAKDTPDRETTTAQSELISNASKADAETSPIVADRTELSNNKAPDIEMKEESGGSLSEEKPVEEMQASPKIPAVDQVIWYFLSSKLSGILFNFRWWFTRFVSQDGVCINTVEPQPPASFRQLVSLNG